MNYPFWHRARGTSSGGRAHDFCKFDLVLSLSNSLPGPFLGRELEQRTVRIAGNKQETTPRKGFERRCDSRVIWLRFTIIAIPPRPTQPLNIPFKGYTE